MPLAVVVPAGGSTAIHWVQGNHLGTPVAVTDGSGALVTPSGYSMAGFPGQVRQQAELYYNYYRDYDVSLGRYVQADPIGLDGDTNPYLYAGGNPLNQIDPKGLTTAVIFGDPTSGNPFGHVGIGFSNGGMYSFGTNTPCGSSVEKYLIKQSSYRGGQVYSLDTTREQEKEMIESLKKWCNVPLPPVSVSTWKQAWNDTCATRTGEALEAGGFKHWLLEPGSPFPLDLKVFVRKFSGQPISIPKGRPLPKNIDFDRMVLK
ncbi:RHS repeat domain-containing protein [Sphingopyxis sp. PET50]|uniref:RHS repeat domain-containing protein n=1 Tax=Sphingopyxis sp. PET50 TaxID=2976533 RepID=UPI0021AF51A4|nr:RHS repeat-associated core domain-containing protein [Sphingopyxis sp. PET50]